MNRGLWVAQIVTGVFFFLVGINHFILPDGLPAVMSWMYDLSTTMHVISGIAEVLGGLGLILPAVTRIQPQLVPLAAAGLAAVMLGAIVYHVGRGEWVAEARVLLQERRVRDRRSVGQHHHPLARGT